MEKTFTADQLYGTVPDKLYTSKQFDAWYAFYDIELCILTNAGDSLEIFCYQDKSEYRDVKRLILSEYNVREVKLDHFDY